MPSGSEKPKTLLQRINAVRERCGYIQKDAQAESYRAVSHDAVTAHLRDALISEGVLMLESLLEGETTQDTGLSTRSGNPIIRYEAVFLISFVNVDDGDDRLTLQVPAHANDTGDKAPGKAMSYAAKYALLKTFNIETGENEESREEAAARVEGRQPITGAEYEHLTGLIESTGTDPDKFLAYLAGQPESGSPERLADIGRGLYKFAISALEAKQRKQARAQSQAQGGDDGTA